MPVLLCSLDEVRSRTTSSIGDDAITDLIASASEDIERYVGSWLAPRTDTTLLFDVERASSTLRIPVGIRTLTSLGIASSSQPETAGVYTAVSLSSVLLRPRPTADDPASSIVLTSGYFSRGFNTVSVTGTFGPNAVAARVREAAIELVLLALNYNPGITSETVGDWAQTFADTSTVERDAILATLPAAIAI